MLIYSQWKQELGIHQQLGSYSPTYSVPQVIIQTLFKSLLHWPQSSRNDCSSIVESSSLNDKIDSVGDSNRAPLPRHHFFFLLHQAYQSSLPKVLTLKQPVWCERSFKLTMPWSAVQDRMSKSKKTDRKSRELQWNFHGNSQQYYFENWIMCYVAHTWHPFCCPVRCTKSFYVLCINVMLKLFVR